MKLRVLVVLAALVLGGSAAYLCPNEGRVTLDSGAPAALRLELSYESVVRGVPPRAHSA